MQTVSFLLVFHHYVWSVCFYLFIGLGWHVPVYSRCFVFCYSWLMFVVFILYFDVIVFAYCPVEICCSFIVCLYVLCLGKFRASGDKVVNCFLKFTTDSAHWVSAIFQDLISVVVGLNALVLGSNNETFCFWFEARCTQPIVGFLLVDILLFCSFWVLTMQRLFFPFALELF